MFGFDQDQEMGWQAGISVPNRRIRIGYSVCLNLNPCFVREPKTVTLPLLGFLLWGLALTVHADRNLVDFDSGFDLTKIVLSDAVVRLLPPGPEAALHVETGTSQPWPGLTLPAPGGHWDLSAFGRVELRVRNAGPAAVTVYCRVDNPGADGVRHCVTDHVKVEPGADGILRVPLNRTGGGTLDGKLFGLRGYPAVTGGDDTVDPSNVNQLLVFVNQSHAPHAFEVSGIRAIGSWTRPTAWTSDADPYFPFIDPFGQYRHRDWPGKFHSEEELQERAAVEVAEFSQNPDPEGWDQFGGWSPGPRLQASGFFRVGKYRDKWWLVDPGGRLFWSHGMDCVGMRDQTVTQERENWFENFPGSGPAFGEFSTTQSQVLKGHYAGQSVRTFSFAGANLKRKYGDDWKRVVPAVIHRRLHHWGMNTIGNWSDESVRLLRRTPYTDSVGSGGAPDIEGSEGYWGKFPDVFGPAFEAALNRSMAGRVDRSANDPWCIGYFSDNEMS